MESDDFPSVWHQGEDEWTPLFRAAYNGRQALVSQNSSHLRPPPQKKPQRILPECGGDATLCLVAA